MAAWRYFGLLGPPPPPPPRPPPPQATLLAESGTLAVFAQRLPHLNLIQEKSKLNF